MLDTLALLAFVVGYCLVFYKGATYIINNSSKSGGSKKRSNSRKYSKRRSTNRKSTKKKTRKNIKQKTKRINNRSKLN